MVFFRDLFKSLENARSFIFRRVLPRDGEPFPLSLLFSLLYFSIRGVSRGEARAEEYLDT